jgi:hypothetical protein
MAEHVKVNRKGEAGALADALHETVDGEILSKTAPFQNRGLSDRTIQALINYGLDAPERVLFMTEAQLRTIPGVGTASKRELRAYRVRFISDAH